MRVPWARVAVLRVTGLIDRTGRYYLADLGEELGAGALAGGRSAPRREAGTWAGSGAAGLGLSGPVDARALEAVLAGCHPGTGHPLRSGRSSIAAYDLTFAAPKSVSVLFGLGDERTAAAVLEAHRSASAEALGYVARRAAAVRRGSGEDRRLVPVEGVIAASFTHGVSRAMDPHLHSHVVVANVAHGTDGRWTSIDGRGMYAHARAAGALYDAHLRHVLSERLGVTWSQRRSGAYEIASVDPLLIGAMSSRQAEIRGHLLARGSPVVERSAAVAASARAHAAAWASTRDEKGTRTPDALRRLWRFRAAAVGFTEPDLGPAPTAARSAAARAVAADVTASALDEHRFAAALHAGTSHVAPTRRDVVAAWAGAVRAGAAVQSVERCVAMVAEWGIDVGVREQGRLLSAVLVSPQVLRALGPRPASPEMLATWRSAAAAIERYRARWIASDRRGAERGPGGSGDGRDAVGFRAQSAALAAMPSRQLAEHLAVSRQVAEARRRLGRAPARQVSVPERTIGRG